MFFWKERMPIAQPCLKPGHCSILWFPFAHNLSLHNLIKLERSLCIVYNKDSMSFPQPFMYSFGIEQNKHSSTFFQIQIFSQLFQRSQKVQNQIKCWEGNARLILFLTNFHARKFKERFSPVSSQLSKKLFYQNRLSEFALKSSLDSVQYWPQTLMYVIAHFKVCLILAQFSNLKTFDD